MRKVKIICIILSLFVCLVWMTACNNDESSEKTLSEALNDGLLMLLCEYNPESEDVIGKDSKVSCAYYFNGDTVELYDSDNLTTLADYYDLSKDEIVDNSEKIGEHNYSLSIYTDSTGNYTDHEMIYIEDDEASSGKYKINTPGITLTSVLYDGYLVYGEGETTIPYVDSNISAVYYIRYTIITDSLDNTIILDEPGADGIPVDPN